MKVTTENFEMIAKTFAGLEQVLAKEISEMGGKVLKFLIGQSSFREIRKCCTKPTTFVVQHYGL